MTGRQPACGFAGKAIACFLLLLCGPTALAAEAPGKTGVPTSVGPHVYRSGYPPFKCPDGSPAVVIGSPEGPVYRCPDGSTKPVTAK
jgi:hypothetical protein